MLLRKTIFVVAVAGLVAGCSGVCRNRTDRAAAATMSRLASAADTLEIDGVRLFLETYLWRDFQPVAPPNGESLMANVRLMSGPGERVPDGLAIERWWVVNGRQCWEAVPRADRPLEEPASVSWQTDRTATGGPKWGPGITVDVVALVVRGDSSWLVRARNQPIHRTD